MRSELRVGGVTVNISRDVIPITMGWTYTANEQWRYIDGEGHEHRYDGGYPTLDYIIDERHWCDGSEGMGGHDPHWAVDESHYECKLCREVIEPALDPPGTTKYVSGPWTAEVEATRSDGVHIVAVLSPDSAVELRQAVMNGDDLQALVDAIGDEHIIQRTRS